MSDKALHPTAGATATGTAFVYDPIFLEHDTGPGHVERPERIEAILQRLHTSGLMDKLVSLSPVRASRNILELAHTPRYIQQAEEDILSGSRVLSTDPSPGGDTRLSPATLDAALAAAGAVITAVDAVMEGQVRNAFCCVRPPGHHATRRAGMGFCIFNNVAVGAQYVRMRYGLERVVIIDWDVHHGNGTQDIFERDPGVFFASSHQAGIYPGTGSVHERGIGEAEGTVLNIPLAAFVPEQDFLDLWASHLLPAMEQFRPEFVFISAGFDSHRDDLLGSLSLTEGGFARMTRLAMSIAHQYSHDRLVSTLEGGYNVHALAGSVEAHLREMMR